MNKDQKKALLDKLRHLFEEAAAIHRYVHGAEIRELNTHMMEPIMNQIHSLKLSVEKFALEEPSKDGLYWAKSARCEVYHLVLVTGDQVQGILEKYPSPIATAAWKDYKPAAIKDPAGVAWIPNL